ncbi:MAG: hypothetical protein HFG32_05315 [Eubacterium sp.]|jgi:uncharacterized phage protein gp47/JayE|nr:hypothetical protein [Eubacterium sp.]
MISEEILDKVCPVPDEDEEMERIRNELEDEGFIINNFNKGGIFYLIIRIFVTIYIEIKTLARTVINNLFIKHADEDWLEIKAPDFGKARKEAVKAQGYITVYRNEYQNALQITKGHMFKTLPDVNGKELKYYVLETTVIGAGEESGRVLVEAEESGTSYNLPSGKITISMIHLDGVEAVSNEEGWLHLEGSDIEDIEDFRERIGESWSELAELTTEDKLKNVARKVSGVLNVEVDAQHPRGQGTTDIIITGTGGEATKELLQRVEAATSYLKGNYDDFLYKSSTVIRQDVTLAIYISKEASVEGVKATAEHIIEDVLQLGKREELNCLYMDDVRYALKKGIADCKRVEFSKPVADIEEEKDVVVMLGSLEVEVLNVGGA